MRKITTAGAMLLPALLLPAVWSAARLAEAAAQDPPAAARPTLLLLHPDAPEMNRRAPDRFRVRMETTKGVVVFDIVRAWAPHGVDRFYNLVNAGYYDDSRVFRAIEGKWVQFGIAGDPRVSTAWRERAIPDDPPGETNARGTVAFAFAVPNGRTTQVFINLRDNAETHDKEPFVPLGRVVAGMDVVDALNTEYGESSGGGIRAGRQAPMFESGNAWLDANFPRLDTIRRMVVLDGARQE